MTDSIKKIYVDSRYRSGGTHADFIVNLPYDINLSENTKMFIDDIIIPNSIKTINTNNNILYLKIYYNGTERNRYMFMPHSTYNASSYTTALETAINTAINDLEVSVIVGYNFTTNIISITLSDDRATPVEDDAYIKIYSDYNLLAGNTPFTGLTVSNIKSMNDVIGMSENDFTIQLGGPWYGYLDLHTVRALYLTSTKLSTYDTISNFNISGIIKKIPMKAGYNEILFDNNNTMFDYVSLGKMDISSFDIQLRDTKYKVIDLNNTHWSFTINFVNLNT